jgi:dTDP-4-amino-4,6-dideoxygalactose transaminase
MMIDQLPPHLKQQDIVDFPGLTPHQVVEEFERRIANFFGAPYCISTDSCTHALELCLRLHTPTNLVKLTKWTYMSIPMMLDKLRIPYVLDDIKWQDSYHVTDQIIDAAVMWQSHGYQPGTFTCLSFQHKKHCPIGRGGAILLDSFDDYQTLYRMVFDGRDRNLIQTDDVILSKGFHYYLTPEDAARGIKIFEWVKNIESEKKSWQNYRDLLTYDYFKNAGITNS